MVTEGIRGTTFNGTGERRRFSGGIVALAIVVLLAMALLNAFVARPTGLTYNPRQQLIVTAISFLMITVAIFLAMFAALQCAALVDARGRWTGRTTMLARLATELALLVATTDYEAALAGYQDPIRLLTPTLVLTSDLLHPTSDREIIGALFALRTAVERYNDFVLTNALLLAEGHAQRAAPVATQYRQAVQDTVSRVRLLLLPAA